MYNIMQSIKYKTWNRKTNHKPSTVNTNIKRKRQDAQFEVYSINTVLHDIEKQNASHAILNMTYAICNVLCVRVSVCVYVYNYLYDRAGHT